MAWNVESVTPDDTLAIAAVRELWTAYWHSLGLPFDFQGFAEELRELPGKYSPPKGRLYLVRIDGHPVATAALRPLADGTCEAKRLYVHPNYRRRGIAATLLTTLLEDARALGYRNLFADTLPNMTAALDLYLASGFEEVGPYSEVPTPSAVYFRKTLAPVE